MAIRAWLRGQTPRLDLEGTLPAPDRAHALIHASSGFDAPVVAGAFRFASAVAGFVCLCVYLGVIDPRQLPIFFSSPSLSGREDIIPNIAAHIAITIGRTEAALILGLLCYMAALLAGRGAIHSAFRAVAVIYQAVPPLVSAPLLMLAFHVTEKTFVLAGAAYIFAGLVATTDDKNLCETRQAEFSRMVGHTWFHRLIWLYGPLAFIRVRPALSMLWLVLVGVVVVIEFQGASSGLGRALSVMNSYDETGAIAISTGTLAAIVAAIAISFLVKQRHGPVENF